MHIIYEITSVGTYSETKKKKKKMKKFYQNNTYRFKKHFPSKLQAGSFGGNVGF